MNRKQKVLTIIALIAFVVIGAGPVHFFYHKFVPFDQAKWNAEVVAWQRDAEVSESLPEHFYDSDHGRWVFVWASRDHPARIQDVRMPWFMLGVIYAALFFLLADKKEKRP